MLKGEKKTNEKNKNRNTSCRKLLSVKRKMKHDFKNHLSGESTKFI